MLFVEDTFEPQSHHANIDVARENIIEERGRVYSVVERKKGKHMGILLDPLQLPAWVIHVRFNPY